MTASIEPLKVGYGICETPADFENTQLEWSYPLSFNTDSDSTHSKYMDAQGFQVILQKWPKNSISIPNL